MNMKKIGSLAFGLAVLGLASCATDEPVNKVQNQPSAGEKDTYATITVTLPSSGTRAVDENGIYTPDGEEVGQDYENNVGKIVVALATKVNEGQYNLLTYAISDSKEVVGSNKLQYVLNFSSKEMTPDVVADDKTTGNNTLNSQDVYVFAYCNPSQALLTQISESWEPGFNLASSIGSIATENGAWNEAMWSKNTFLMTNYTITKVETDYEDHRIPTRDVLVSKHNTPANALNLGSIDVERAAARFDFMTVDVDGEGMNKYVIKDIDGKTAIGVVELTDMAMFNISKTFYYLPRTNSQWNWLGTTTLCSGLDNSNNFVVSTNRSLKVTTPLPASQLGTSFFWPINDMSGYQWQSIEPTAWNNRENDTDEGWNPSEGTTYKIWRYATENTIPQWGDSDNKNGSQRVGITTGVAFKGKFTPNDKNVWNGNVVYVYNNIVYGDFKALKDYVATSPDTDVAKAFAKVSTFNVADDKIDQVLQTNLLSTLTSEQSNGFSAYVTDADGSYLMYYFYYNRHNSNGINTTLGTNEFGVVRNNVYKLRVSTVNSLGRPTPPDPNTEDENEEAYFSVDVKVLPWVVRINDIEF